MNFVQKLKLWIHLIGKAGILRKSTEFNRKSGQVTLLIQYLKISKREGVSRKFFGNGNRTLLMVKQIYNAQLTWQHFKFGQQWYRWASFMWFQVVPLLWPMMNVIPLRLMDHLYLNKNLLANPSTYSPPIRLKSII